MLVTLAKTFNILFLFLDTIGIVVGIISKKFGFSIKTVILTGILLAILAPLIGTPIAVSLFGGLAGGSMDILTGWFVKSG